MFVAMREIEPGEELLHDWATTDDLDYTMKCRCGSAQCRVVVTGQDWRRPELQQKYRGWFSWFLQRKLDQLGSNEAKPSDRGPWACGPALWPVGRMSGYPRQACAVLLQARPLHGRQACGACDLKLAVWPKTSLAQDSGLSQPLPGTAGFSLGPNVRSRSGDKGYSRGRLTSISAVFMRE